MVLPGSKDERRRPLSLHSSLSLCRFGTFDPHCLGKTVSTEPQLYLLNRWFRVKQEGFGSLRSGFEAFLFPQICRVPLRFGCCRSRNPMWTFLTISAKDACMSHNRQWVEAVAPKSLNHNYLHTFVMINIMVSVQQSYISGHRSRSSGLTLSKLTPLFQTKWWAFFAKIKTEQCVCGFF